MSEADESRRAATIGGDPVEGLIRRARRVARMSQRELATAAAVGAGLVGGIEAGRVTPSLATVQRLLEVAGFTLVVIDTDGRRVQPMRTWQDVADLAKRRFPAHLDLILDPELGEWWADIYGLARPPETFRRQSAKYRDWQRRLSRWEVRAKLCRDDPWPRYPHGEYRKYPRAD